MKLILQKDVKNLGKTGDQVAVKKGYARNFLIPQGKALLLNTDRLKVWKHQKVIIEAKKRQAILERKALIEKLSSVNLKFEKECLKNGKLFGSVTAYDISQTLEKKYNISVDKRDFSLATLKTVGNHKITINLDTEHKTDITVSIQGKITKKRKQSVDSSSKLKEPSKNQEENKETSEQELKGKAVDTPPLETKENSEQELEDITVDTPPLEIQENSEQETEDIS